MAMTVFNTPAGIGGMAISTIEGRCDQWVTEADPSIKQRHNIGIWGVRKIYIRYQVLHPVILVFDRHAREGFGGDYGCRQSSHPTNPTDCTSEGFPACRCDYDDIFRKFKTLSTKTDTIGRCRREEGLGGILTEPDLPDARPIGGRELIRRAPPERV